MNCTKTKLNVVVIHKITLIISVFHVNKRIRYHPVQNKHSKDIVFTCGVREPSGCGDRSERWADRADRDPDGAVMTRLRTLYERLKAGGHGNQGLICNNLQDIMYHFNE